MESEKQKIGCRGTERQEARLSAQGWIHTEKQRAHSEASFLFFFLGSRLGNCGLQGGGQRRGTAGRTHQHPGKARHQASRMPGSRRSPKGPRRCPLQ